MGPKDIKVNGEKIVKEIRIFSLSLTKAYEFNVGTDEKHRVKIEVIRKLLFAGLREFIGKVYVDGNILYEFKGNLSLDDIFLR